MDKTEEEPTYQYLTLKNGEGQYNIQDFLTMPEGTSNNKQIFYLTFNGNDEENKEEISGQDDSVEEDNLEFGGTDVKLITLDDGQVFLASDNNIYSSNSCTSFLDQGEEEQESLDIAQLSNAEEPLDENSEVSYQLVELEDGSEAVIKIIKIKNDSIKNEPPKKIKRFHCEFEGCEKVYGSSYHLTVHMRSHTDDKPYPCVVDGCEKSFSTNYSLKAHIRTHTGEKPYACVICTKPFKTSGDLQKHVRIHTGEKPFECPVFGCGKAFTTSNIRKVHIRSHTGERPYSCSYLNCGKAFTSSTNYKNHLRIHSGEKPYVCAVEGCGKRFTEYSSLYKHNAIHQPVRLHVCIFCGRRFKQESALNFHKRLKHNVVVTKDGTEIIVKIE